MYVYNLNENSLKKLGGGVAPWFSMFLAGVLSLAPQRKCEVTFNPNQYVRVRKISPSGLAHLNPLPFVLCYKEPKSKLPRPEPSVMFLKS